MFMLRSRSMLHVQREFSRPTSPATNDHLAWFACASRIDRPCSAARAAAPPAPPRRQISKRLASRRSIQARPPMRLLNCFAFALLGSASVAAAELPIFDAHVHYSHDAWENVPPKIAIELLRKAGIKRALVSSSNDEGNQKLIAEAPDL